MITTVGIPTKLPHWTLYSQLSDILALNGFKQDILLSYDGKILWADMSLNNFIHLGVILYTTDVAKGRLSQSHLQNR